MLSIGYDTFGCAVEALPIELTGQQAALSCESDLPHICHLCAPSHSISIRVGQTGLLRHSATLPGPPGTRHRLSLGRE